VVSLPGVSHWSPAQRRGLLDVIKARGGRTERAYVEALQRAPLGRRRARGAGEQAARKRPHAVSVTGNSCPAAARLVA
jgi:hypothetical protein